MLSTSLITSAIEIAFSCDRFETKITENEIAFTSSNGCVFGIRSVSVDRYELFADDFSDGELLNEKWVLTAFGEDMLVGTDPQDLTNKHHHLIRKYDMDF
jgi:hypothetical protein